MNSATGTGLQAYPEINITGWQQSSPMSNNTGSHISSTSLNRTSLFSNGEMTVPHSINGKFNYIIQWMQEIYADSQSSSLALGSNSAYDDMELDEFFITSW